MSHQLLAEAEADEAGDGEGIAEFLALGFQQSGNLDVGAFYEALFEEAAFGEELADLALENVFDDVLRLAFSGEAGTEYDFSRKMNVAIAGRLDSEVPDDDPLQPDVDQIRSASDSRAAIDERSLKTIACWTKINIVRAAATPVQPPVVVRGTTAATYETRWTCLPGKRQTRETDAGNWRAVNSTLRADDRRLDLLNKAWYQAWFSEFPAGTPEGDALAGIDTEGGSAMPQVLEIAAIVQQGLFLKVTYLPGSGAHATVLNLQYLGEGENADFQSLTAISASGNLIGPFTQVQIVRLRTDVGNSRDHSELSPEQVVTIAASV